MLSGGPSVDAVAGLHQSNRAKSFPLRSSGIFAHACCVTTSLTAGLVLLYRSAFKHQEKKNNPAHDNNADDFTWKSWKKRRKFSICTSPIRTALIRDFWTYHCVCFLFTTDISKYLPYLNSTDILHIMQNI